MLQIISEPRPAGKRAPPRDATDADTSARAREISRRRDELLGMLHDLPESDHELSLTDLVEKAAAGGGGGAPDVKEPSPANRSASNRRMEAQAGKERLLRRRTSRSSRDGGSSFRSSSDGVLLNLFVPAALTRSFTAPRTSRASADCTKREREGVAGGVKCWPSLWDLWWRRKPRRPGAKAPHDESAVCAASAAILKAANHSNASEKF